MSTAKLPENTALAPADGMVRIILEENDEIPPTGQFIGLNGTGYILTPGVEAEVPRGLLDVLDHAVMSVPVVDPVTRQIVDYKERRRLPYRLV